MKQPKDFKQAKELKHPKQGRNTSYVSLHQIPTKDLHFSKMRHLNNPTFHFQAFQLCGISTSQHLDDKLSGENILSPLLKNETSQQSNIPFSSISTLRYLHIPTFGRQVIRGKHFHSSVIKANRVGRVISATGHLNSSTFRSVGTSREVDHLYVPLP